MFRITSEITQFGSDMHFVHKKFFKWWIKWSHKKNSNAVRNNVAISLIDLIDLMENGSYQFSTGENPHYWEIKDPHWPDESDEISTELKYIEEYVQDAQEYKLNHSERFI